jgi:hypothetical protein
MADKNGASAPCCDEQQSGSNKHRHFLTDEAVEKPTDKRA